MASEKQDPNRPSVSPSSWSDTESDDDDDYDEPREIEIDSTE